MAHPVNRLIPLFLAATAFGLGSLRAEIQSGDDYSTTLQPVPVATAHPDAQGHLTGVPQAGPASSSATPVHATIAVRTLTPGPIGPSIINPAAPNSFETEVETLEQRLQGAPSDPIVFYGSSSIRLWRTLQQDFAGYPVSNCGFGGSRLTDCIKFAPRLVLKLKPRAVVLYAGDNDLAQGTSPDQAFDSFQRLFHILRSYSETMPIAFISVKPCPARMKFFQHILRFNQMVNEYLEDQPNADYIDICSAILEPDRQPNPALFRNDKIHLSAAGYDILRKDVGEFLHEEFSKSASAVDRSHRP